MVTIEPDPNDVVVRTLVYSRAEMRRRGQIGGRVAAARGRQPHNLELARRAREASFTTPEARIEFFRRLGRAGVEARLRRAADRGDEPAAAS
ncbi:MAG: hypothetical protein ACJ789_19470 [Thermomicrobiales bacterium]